MADKAEHFLDHAGFDRGPWLAVALAAGIAAWLLLGSAAQWVLALSLSLGLALGAIALWKGRDDRGRLLTACVALGLTFALGLGVIWARSELVGVPGIARPYSGTFEARVLERIEQPAEGRTRLVLATRDPDNGAAIRVRVNVPLEDDDPAFRTGALLRLQARLMPPQPPMLPGSYNFARTAWFEGLAATGSVQGAVELLEPSRGVPLLESTQSQLSVHVRSQLGGTPGAIAAAFASGCGGFAGAAGGGSGGFVGAGGDFCHGWLPDLAHDHVARWTGV